MKKGFTLVELLAVVVILGVLALITTITIGDELKESQEKIYETQLEDIKELARTWSAANAFSLPSTDGSFITLTLGQLKQEGYTGDIINTKTNQPFSDSLQVKISFIDNNYVYEIVE